MTVGQSLVKPSERFMTISQMISNRPAVISNSHAIPGFIQLLGFRGFLRWRILSNEFLAQRRSPRTIVAGWVEDEHDQVAKVLVRDLFKSLGHQTQLAFANRR